MLTLSGMTRALASPREDEDKKITPEEEREARELVEEFNKKFVETHDIAPLIKDYFVSDFASRLNQHADTFPFILLELGDGWKDKAAPPDPGDLLRFYVASTNSLQSLFPLMYDAYKKAEKQRGEEDERKEPKLDEMLPPAAVELIKSDPLLRAAWEEMEKPDDDDSVISQADATSAKGDKSYSGDEERRKNYEELKIDNSEKLRHLTSVLEGISKILREHLATHPVTFEKADKSEGEESGEKKDEVSFDPERVKVFENARILRQEFYGYPEGTRLICADAGALHIEMIRVDGRLRILTVFLLMDD